MNFFRFIDVVLILEGCHMSLVKPIMMYLVTTIVYQPHSILKHLSLDFQQCFTLTALVNILIALSALLLPVSNVR